MSCYYKFLFENNLLEGYFKSKTPAGKLSNQIIDELKSKNIKIDNEHYKFSGSEINSFYFDVIRYVHFLEVNIPLRFKCRCSNHIKPNLEKATDIKVLIPNQNKFDNDLYKRDEMFYMFGEGYSDKYKRQAIIDIINKFNEETEKIEKIIKKINKQFILFYKNHTKEEVSNEYNISKDYLEKPWFKEILDKISRKIKLLNFPDNRTKISLPKKDGDPTQR